MLSKTVNKLCTTITLMGNPFTKDMGKLMALDTHVCVFDDDVLSTFHNMETMGI